MTLPARLGRRPRSAFPYHNRYCYLTAHETMLYSGVSREPQPARSLHRFLPSASGPSYRLQGIALILSVFRSFRTLCRTAWGCRPFRSSRVTVGRNGSLLSLVSSSALALSPPQQGECPIPASRTVASADHRNGLAL